jgi:DNA-binding winged helix-turn-helix (wHTH) protein
VPKITRVTKLGVLTVNTAKRTIELNGNKKTDVLPKHIIRAAALLARRANQMVTTIEFQDLGISVSTLRQTMCKLRKSFKSLGVDDQFKIVAARSSGYRLNTKAPSA